MPFSGPLHPALVHMPLTFLISASVADLLTHTAQFSPIIVAPLTSLTSTSTPTLIQSTTLFSYTLTIAALITAVPAAVSGILQAGVVVSTRGKKAKSVKTMQLHAALMDVSILAAAYNWYSRRGAQGFRSEQINALLSVGTLALVTYAAMLGKSLVFEHGLGVSKVGQASKGAVGEKKEL